MEYISLYRKFRPKKFSEIIGQDHITQTLQNQVIAGRVGHAYLFTGCRGCGKTTSAKILARAVNCLNPKDGEPCNECEICKAALEGSLTDIVEMDAASNNGVDNIRAIRDEVNFLPTLAKYRVYIIDEVHMLSSGAFNALLKTLEEPPKHVKFILATTEPQKLPATILSRCQRFDFKQISEENIVINLKKICAESNIKYTENALNLIAELSEGAMRDSISILERCSQDGENNITEEKIKDLVGIPALNTIENITENIFNYNTQAILEETKNIINSGKDINNFIWELIKYIRDTLLLKTTDTTSNIYTDSNKNKMKELSEKIDQERFMKIIYSLSELENSIKWSSQRNIMFQVGLLRLCEKENMTLEERIKAIEEQLKNGVPVARTNNNINKPNSIKQNISNNIPTAKVEEKKVEIKKEKQQTTPKVSGKEADFWSNVIDSLKEQRMPMLYSNLINTKGIIIDDLTIGIEFPSGLTSFGRSVIEKPENMQELKRLVSIECKKDMRIKLIDDKANANNQETTAKPINLGININMIDE